MLIVSDTSPIVNLAIIERLYLLPRLYGKVIVPEAVFLEITVQGAGEPGADEVRAADWIAVKQCRNREMVIRLRRELDEGEAEAIVLAIELKADRILIDESAGRRVAVENALHPVGVLGVLLRAKKEGLLSSVQFEMERLKHEAGFFIHKNLFLEVLRLAGE